jgi:signal transduction histidine kinase
MKKKLRMALNKSKEFLNNFFMKEIDLNVSVSDALGINNERLDSVEMAHEIKTPLLTALYNLDSISGNIESVESIRVSLLHIKEVLDNSNYNNNNDIYKICKDAITVTGGRDRIVIKDKLKQRFIVRSDNITKIRQIYIILLSNALKYSLERSKIYLSLYEKDNQIHSEIYSKGYTIERKEWGRIFIRGKRLNNALDKPGSGLGLSIAYRLSKKIKANLLVKKSDNNETIFSFILNK